MKKSCSILQGNNNLERNLPSHKDYYLKKNKDYETGGGSRSGNIQNIKKYYDDLNKKKSPKRK